MKNIQNVLSEALNSYNLEINEKSISNDINEVILEILVNDEPFEKINSFFYSKREPERILKSSVNYVLILLERAKYRVQRFQKNNHNYLYIIKKIDYFIEYLINYDNLYLTWLSLYVINIIIEKIN